MPILLKGLLHNPYGLEHPYQQEPVERFPRNPIAGQPVTVGLATWPAGAAERVWASWSVTGSQEETRAEAEWAGDLEEQSLWKAELPPFSIGQKISYHCYAAQGDQQICSEPFTFHVFGWQESGEVTGYQWTADGLELVFRSSQAGVGSHLQIAFLEQDLVRFDWRWEEAAGLGLDENSVPPGIQRIEESRERLIIAYQGLRFSIQLRPYRLEIQTPEGEPILVESQSPAWLTQGTGVPSSVRQSFIASPGEGFFGFGERFNGLDQRGNRLDVRVFEQYKDQGSKTYIPVPFSLSSRGYGLYLATSRYVTYNLAASQPDRWSFEAELGPDGGLEYFVMLGRPAQLLRLFTNLTGKPKLPPNWVFGPWMSANEWNSQAQVMEQVRQTLQHRIPAAVLVIEAWSDESTFYIWNGAQYTPHPPDKPFTYGDFTFPPDGPWPDPKAMIAELHRLGIRLILWQIPVMKKLETPHPQHDADEAFMLEKGYQVRELDGKPYRVRPFWFHDSLLLDVTNREGLDWWLGKRAYLLDELEVDGFKTDGGEHLWGRNLVFSNGMRGDEAWNLYPNLYVEAYYRFACQQRGGEAVTFSRAGFTGAQAFPCHWAGDENSTWEAFRASIFAGLNAGISGIPFWGWDLAGFSGEIPTAELYLRATAMAAFCPIMQYHSEYNHHRQPCRDRTPWNIAEQTGQPEVIEIYRKFAQLRMELIPYIEGEAKYSSETGEPLMRPLFLDWPEESQAWTIGDQYCFGRALLVAPVIQPGSQERSLYLPPGEWQDFWDGTQRSGGRWITRPAPIDIIPVYRRLDYS